MASISKDIASLIADISHLHCSLCIPLGGDLNHALPPSFLNESVRPPVKPEEVQQLLSFQNSTDENVLSKIIEACGTLGRREVNRKTLTDGRVIEVAVPLLTHTNKQIQAFALRAIANLCFDSAHASADEARVRVESLGGVHIIAGMFNHPEDANYLTMLLGCIGNLVSNTEHLAIQFTTLGVLQKICECASHPFDMVSGLACQAIANMAVSEDIRILAFKSGGYKSIIGHLIANNPGNLVQAFEALSSLSDSDVIRADFFEAQRGFDIIFNLIQSYEFISIDMADDEEQYKDMKEEASEMIKAIYKFLIHLASNEESYRLLFLTQKAVPRFLSKIKESSNTNIREESSKVISYLTLSDEINEKVLRNEVKEFISWTKEPSQELRMSAAMILGNLAQDHHSSAFLISSGAIECLLNQLSTNIEDLSAAAAGNDVEEQEENIATAAKRSEWVGKENRIKHLSAAALKNLSVTPEHKALILKERPTIFQLLVRLLSTPRNDIVVHSSITLIKSLIVLGPHAIDLYFEADKDALKMISLCSKVEEVKKDDHVFYDASRVVASIFNHASAEFLNNWLSDGRNKFKTNLHPIDCLVNLILSKYLILVSEGTAMILKLLQSNLSNFSTADTIDRVFSSYHEQVIPILSTLTVHVALKISDRDVIKPTQADDSLDLFPLLATFFIYLLENPLSKPHLLKDTKDGFLAALSKIEQSSNPTHKEFVSKVKSHL